MTKASKMNDKGEEIGNSTKSLMNLLMLELKRHRANPSVDVKDVNLLSEIFTSVAVNHNERLTKNMRVILDYYVAEKKFGIDELIELISNTNSYLDQVSESEKRDGFDELHSTFTSEPFEQFELLEEEMTIDKWRNCSAYVPSPTGLASKALRALGEIGLDPTQFEFVDIGSGLGKVLILAGEYPFKRITGIELSAHLHKICLANLKNHVSSGQKCYNIGAECGDAMLFDLPKSSTVFYFWEPFSPDLGNRFIARVIEFIASNPYKVVLVFVGVVYSLATESGSFKLLRRIEAPNAKTRYESNGISIFSN